MKKLLLGVLLLALGLLAEVPVQASTNDFTISSYDVQMELGRDGENRSLLEVTETITAEFPEVDQNHGLERAFVKTYNGHSLAFNLTGVTDANGTELPYHWSDESLRIGDADVYVHGTQTYVLSYTMRDVTKYYADTGLDEFYWDVIGTDWQVPIQQATVQLEIESMLWPTIRGEVACYVGVAGATERCDVTTTATGYRVNAENIGRGKGVTLAVGFSPGTFAEYRMSLIEQLVIGWIIVQVVLTIVGLGLIGWLIWRWYSLTNRHKEIGTIIPEYLPPNAASVTASARLGNYTHAVMTAQLLDLAVRGYLKLYQVKEKTFFQPAEYEIEIVKDVSGLYWEEQELLKDTFDTTPTTGQRLNLKTLQNNTQFYSRTLNNDTELDKRIRGEYGLRAHDEGLKAWARRRAGIIAIVGLLLLSPMILVAAFVALIVSFFPWRLTDTGLALKRYLEGLKLYIEVAEVERINMLQTPEAAEKIATVADGLDGPQLIKLYEQVLPYAVLFNQEKQWNKQLGAYYETNNLRPTWYGDSSGVFNAAVFASAMNSFETASTSVSSSSSSSGGSSGGGSSGGGGGGGGGGGW